MQPMADLRPQFYCGGCTCDFCVEARIELLKDEVRRLELENARLRDQLGGRVGWGPPTGPRTATWGEVCQEDAAS